MIMCAGVLHRLSEVTLVRDFHVVLIHHCILQCSIKALMAKEVLNLLDRHTFVNRHCGEGATELVWVYSRQVQLLPKAAQSHFDSAYLEPFVRRKQRHEECILGVGATGEIVLEMYLGAGIEIDAALLVAFSGYDALSVLEVYVFAVETHKFAHAHSGRSQKVDDCEITRALAIVSHYFKRLVGIGLFDCFADLYLVDAAYRALDDVVFVFEP